MLPKRGTSFAGLLLIVSVVSTDPGPDKKSVCQNALVPARFKDISPSDQDAWSFIAAPGNFMYALFRNFHSDSENKGTNKCVMVQKVPYNECGETKFANYTKWFNATTCLPYAMRSFDSVVKLDGTQGTTKNVMVARHQVGGHLTKEFCYPFVYTDAKCAVVLMSHWNHAAKIQCEKNATAHKQQGGENAPETGENMPCQTACEMWVRHENLNETSLNENCTKYYKQFCGDRKIFLYDKRICDRVEKLPVNITKSISEDQ
ncbi:uncharacterized protein LOC115320764 [Ixodes scapularis]|uniref:uncharacterized protein LOC115320764 n=1 Tax=Ixodes scapularis TaxID=6945 RepID=UPI001C394729|nr:uncharacterized protein LOC115320764 [Ixodes scapularis]